MEHIGLEYQGYRQWSGVEVIWYAMDRSTFVE